jgi:flagellar protein FliO/FliZ
MILSLILLASAYTHAATSEKVSAESKAAPAIESTELADPILPENELVKLETELESQMNPAGDVAPAAAKAEKEIAVQLEAPAKAAESSGNFGRAMAALAIFSVLGIGLVVYLRRNAKPGMKNQQTQIKVLTQHWLGPKKQLSIIRVAGETILIGITDTQITHIKTLSLVDEEIPEDVPANFNGALKKFEVQDNEDDFAISGIKDFVSKKLKGMRTLE